MTKGLYSDTTDTVVAFQQLRSGVRRGFVTLNSGCLGCPSPLIVADTSSS